MLGRIVEVADDRRHLSLLRGFMVVTETGDERREMGRIPLDDIAALIANAHGVSYTNNLLVSLAQRCAPVVLCAANHNVAGMLLPVDGNFQQAKRFDAQLAASAPRHKQVWAALVKCKLQFQSLVLAAIGAPTAPVEALIGKVRSGDPDNIEAQAARRYWPLLMGEDFRRDRQAAGANAMLNYGYTILRATTARAVVGAGLHPTLGVHHTNEGNAMRLVDDLMEPFRPLVDYRVWLSIEAGSTAVDVEVKAELVRLMYADMRTAAGMTPVAVCIQRLATSLAQLYLGEAEQLELPESELPLDMVAANT